MKQLLQRLDSGETSLQDMPVPVASGPNLVVETRASVVSAGTERMLVQFGRSNLLEKARSQPEKVRQVLTKMRTDGVSQTIEAVRAKMEAPIPLGYCHAGVVVGVGSRSGGFAVGDRVVTNGPHAEYVRVPFTLAARIPDGVPFENAAFTPIAAIGLQGIRLAAPSLGETVVVFGLGLIGLLTVQMLRANGCRVIGIDRDAGRLAMAEAFGAQTVAAGPDVAARVAAMTGGIGADAVLLTLASSSQEPIRQAAAMSRKRGRLVLVGVTGLDLVREDFFGKELSFTVSCSYGPGRYDPSYEEGAQDYPIGFVRWTEQRNFEAVLALMAAGQLDPRPLVTHRFEFENAPAAYDVISSSEPNLGVVLEYADRGGTAPAPAMRTLETTRPATTGAASGRSVVGVIGAGNFAVRTLLPVLRGSGARLHTIASGGGTSGAIAAGKFGFERVTTDLGAVFENEDIDTVFILTRHDSHAALAVKALECGKDVFVEKPLALTEDELDAVIDAAQRTGRRLMVGFNRRFAPLTLRAREFLEGRRGPLSVVATINAGSLPPDHWTVDPDIGGGRIVGEACHWLDLARVLIGSEITSLAALAARHAGGRSAADIAHLSLGFADGSTAVIHYLSSGANSFPKERIECFWEGKTLMIDNWRRLRTFGVKRRLFARAGKMDKGHAATVTAWLRSLRQDGPGPIPLSELEEVSRWAVRAERSVRGQLGADP